jgi:hypothetical protein
MHLDLPESLVQVYRFARRTTSVTPSQSKHRTVPEHR